MLMGNSMRLVGVCGKAGAGKDTVADHLVSKHGFVKVSFAAILKDMLRVAGLPEPSDRALKEAILPGFTFSWREAAQKLGTEFGRALDTDIWVKLSLANLDSDKSYVFSDVRFDNEADAIRRKGGGIIHLEGRGVDLGFMGHHASEKGVTVLASDYKLFNTQSKVALYDWLDAMIEARVVNA